MLPVRTAAVFALFALTYALIAGRRPSWLPIGRTGGAMLGAVGMVALGALTPEAAFSAIDHNTIALLLGMMIVTVYLERAGAFERVASLALSRARTGFALLGGVALVSAGLSAILVNDTACVFLTPVVVAACKRAKLPFGPYLIALATSANIGSSGTLVGNPQNMIIGGMSHVPFARFTALAAPASAAALVVNIGLLWWMYRKQLPDRLELAAMPLPPAEGGPRASAVVLAIIAAFFLGLNLGFVALAGAVALIVLDRRDPRDVLAAVDWSLLLFFCGLFISVAGFASTGLVDRAWAIASPSMMLDVPSGIVGYTAFVTVGSNLVSNVPLVLLAGPHTDALHGGESGWVLLAFTSTIAGNFTLVGSVANLIVAERARDAYVLGFREYSRFGALSTIVSLIVGVAVIALVARLIG
jgi:Na+/H+ antiporter NhaD/arsenite permease-like protein